MTGGAVLIRPAGNVTVIAAPVRVTGEMAGSLVAQLPGDTDQYTEQRDQLAAFAQQVSLALTDARTVEAVREAHHDPVTGLPNRALFLKILDRCSPRRGTAADPTRAVHRPRPVQGGQRQPRPRGRRRAARGVARPAAQLRAGQRHRRPARRRRVRRRCSTDSTAEATPCWSRDRIVASLREPFRIAGRDVFIGASVGIATSRRRVERSETLLEQRGRGDVPGEEGRAGAGAGRTSRTCTPRRSTI